MASIEELRAERLKKLESLESTGISAYPAKSNKTHFINEAFKDFENLKNSEKEITLAGRVMSSRGSGAIIFIDLFDGTGKMQAVIKSPESGEEAQNFFNSFVDTGDFIEVTGKLFNTKTGQESILVTKVAMLSKSLLPLPDKYHGLQDEELRMRLRYLDILTNSELRETFEKKAKFWKVVRKFLDEKGFLEVETPTLEVTTGGAEARPFATHHNDFDLDVFMRICIGELWQKRLMASGFPKTFEIGRAYRNEGSSPDHLQEFTNCEFYMAYTDFEDGMKITQELYRTIAQEVFGTTSFTTRGHTFDLADEWKKIDYTEEIIRQTSIDINSATDEEIKNKLFELKVKFDGNNRERFVDTLWKYCRKNISGPAFLINHPVLVAPLAKKNSNGKTVQQFQPILGGSELGRGYSELNDPIDQRKRFEVQQELTKGGDEEAMMADFDFVEMLEHGMPPTCGFGFGERLFAFLSDKPIREVQMFPLVKPIIPAKKRSTVSISTNIDVQVKIYNKKQDFTRRIVIVVRKDVEPWQVTNAVSHLSAYIGNKMNQPFDTGPHFVTKDNKKYPKNSQYNVITKTANSSEQLHNLFEKVTSSNVLHIAFVRQMIDKSDDILIQEDIGKQESKDIEYIGVGIFGNNDEVNTLTKKFSLYN